MSRHAPDTHYVNVLLMLGVALIVLWLRPFRFRVRGLFAHMALTVEGHLRARPDPTLEQALRSAFVGFDRELTLILGDRDPRNRPGRRPGA
jgi:hypothetical protein